MRSVFRTVALGAALVLAPIVSLAEDAALILSGSDYRYLADARNASQIQDLEPSLRDRGFEVFGGLDLNAEESWAAVERFRDAARQADRVFVVLAGHMVTSGNDVWLLTRFARTVNDLNIGAVSVPLQPILDVAAWHPGQAVVLLAPSLQDVGLPEELTNGARPGVLPQGVTLITGPARDVLDIATRVVLEPGAVLGDALSRLPEGMGTYGFVSNAVPFLPGSAAPASDAETAFWEAVQILGTVEAYIAYADRYPYGRYLAQASSAISALRDDPERRAREAEEALRLSKADRQEIQRDLAILGYDPRGIDGIFGNGSRAAIRAWQGDKGFDPTGYLSGNQITALDAQATVRARELEEEAARRRAEEERRDAAYWRSTGRNGDEAGLRAYLESYPDGLYADLARAKLEEIEEAKRAALAAEERATWDQVRASDTAEAYREYLRSYPNGAFADAARARLTEIEEEAGQAAAIAAARSEEARVAGNPVVGLIVENRLASLGYEISSVDGDFDESTRRAIRRFQRTRGLPVTGYVTQETMVHLMVAR
jgi:peptidoglycan hydrolase-like protein with peptidoglycan-binding domain